MGRTPFHTMRLKVLIVLVWSTLFGVTYGMVADLYLNKDKFGEYFKLEISEKGCTNVPLNWENQAVSVDTHGSCIKFYDLPYCRGKYVALQPYHGTFQDNLQTLGFNKIISSASPCGPKVPTGRYYIQNGADGSVLTVETRNGTPVAHAHAFKPYISKGQQFQVEKVALADYEIIPRVHQNMNPLTFDMHTSTSSHPVRRVWKIESVYRGRYLIKNDWNNKCLYKADNGKVEEHDCVAWSPNQEWVFRSIKVKPYFPSKEELNKKPLRPDDKLPFEPQDDAFSPVPYRPAHLPNNGQFNFGPPLPPGAQRPIQHPNIRPGSGSGKKQIHIQRPGPIVINPGEPYPPVFPYPILPSSKQGVKKPEAKKPPVPQIRHPGPLPFPSEPVVTDPRKPVVFSPFDTYNVFPNATQQVSKPGKKPTESEEDEEDEGRDSDEEQDRGESGEQDEGVDEEISEENIEKNRPQGNNERETVANDDEEFNSDEAEGSFEGDYEEEDIPPPDQRVKHQKQKEASAGINYSDFRLFF